jgi:two-component system, NarL family, invasion response regulator UvrY
MEQVVRIVMAQGNCLLRNELIDRLEQESWLKVCATATSGEGLRDLVAEHRADVVLMNISPKCNGGMLSLKALKKAFPKVHALTFACDVDLEDIHANFALRSGADGFVSAADTPAELVKAIRGVVDGLGYVSPHVAPVKKKKGGEGAVLPMLSVQEAEVFCLTGCGLVTKRIAEVMDLKVKTIESYRARILAKMDLDGGADLLYSAVSFMRSSARKGAGRKNDYQMVRELLSAKA